MHHFVLVLVPADTQDIKKAVSTLLEPYSAYKVVEVRKRYVEGPDLQRMAQHYGLSEADLPALAQHLKEYWGDRWREVEKDNVNVVEGGIDEGGLFLTHPFNPRAEWDSWRIGGRYEGILLRKSQDAEGRSNEIAEQEQGDICPVQDISPDFFAWEIVTPDGQWRQGEWWKTSFGVDSVQTEQANQWRTTMWELLEQHADCIAVGIDIHL